MTTEIYEWLYDNYVQPLIKEIQTNQNEVLENLVKELALTPRGEVRLYDSISNLQLRWGPEVFVLGIQFGLRLTAPKLSPSAGSSDRPAVG